MNKKTLIAGVLTLCVSPHTLAISGSSLNTSINISYGTVESVQRVKIDSKAAQGAVLGGMVGAASGHHDRGKHALAGALVGGILSAIIQGKRDAFSYTVLMSGGGEKRVVTEQDDVRVGDCVSVEEGRTTNIREVPKVHCEHRRHAVMQEPMVQSKAHQGAAECHAAKSMALKASTEEEIDVALKKVQIFCD